MGACVCLISLALVCNTNHECIATERHSLVVLQLNLLHFQNCQTCQ